MYYFNENLKDLEDLEIELEKKDITFQSYLDLEQLFVDCFVYQKTYSDGSDVCTLLYVSRRTDVVDHNGRSQYNGSITSFKRNKHLFCINDTLNKVDFEEANYLGLWLLIAATSQAVVEGADNYESIKNSLDQEHDEFGADNKELSAISRHLQLEQDAINLAELMIGDELADEYEFNNA